MGHHKAEEEDDYGSFSGMLTIIISYRRSRRPDLVVCVRTSKKL